MHLTYYSLLEFYGTQKVKDQVKAWATTLEELSSDHHRTKLFEFIDAVFPPLQNSSTNQNDSLNSLYIDTDSLTPSLNQLSFRSSRSDAEQLEARIACALYKLDKRVIIRSSFNCEDGSVGVAYTTPTSKTDAYSQHAVIEYDEDDDLSPEDMIEDKELELLTDYFLDDMPELSKVLKKHRPDLDIDWEDYQ